MEGTYDDCPSPNTVSGGSDVIRSRTWRRIRETNSLFLNCIQTRSSSSNRNTFPIEVATGCHISDYTHPAASTTVGVFVLLTGLAAKPETNLLDASLFDYLIGHSVALIGTSSATSEI